MELRHLRYFVAVAEELHFGRAADRLLIAQPGLSQQISQLERELGVKLFVRSSRHVQLTAAGKLFLEEAKRTVQQADRALAVARRAAQGEIGELRIGYVEQAAHRILASLLPEYRRRHPEVAVSLQLFVTTPDIREALLRDQIDVGFGLGPITDLTLETRLLEREELLVAIREDHPLCAKGSIQLSELSNETWNLWRRELNPPLFESITAFFREAGFLPDVRYESVEPEEIYLWVASRSAVALIPSSTANATTPAGVAVRPLVRPTPHWDHVLVWKRDTVPAVLKSLLELEEQLRRSSSLPPIGRRSTSRQPSRRE